MVTIAEIKRSLTAKKKPVVKTKGLLSLGSTVLNMGCSDSPIGAIPKGNYVLFVGDSSSGKTWLALSCFAEAMISKRFKNYDIVYDNVENGALMDIAHYFGPRVAEKLQPPARDRHGDAVFSTTVESFYYHVHDRSKKGRPFIYVLDSMDALDSEDADELFEANKKASREGAKSKGSYGTKAKRNSEMLRKVLKGIQQTGSVLIIICQTRDNIGFTAQFNPKVFSGGRSLRFYAGMEIWTQRKTKIKKTIKGKPRVIGIITECKIKKNRITGKDRTVEVPIYYDVGIDDTGSCIDYLISEKHWSVVKGMIKAPEFGFKGPREKLVAKIENSNREKELRTLAGDVWKEIENASSIKRKNRYA